MLFFWTFYSSKKPEKKIYSAVFIIHNNNNNNKCILSSKSEYLNDFWTSCDWSNEAENSALITGINYILKYILNIKNISQYYCFCCILDQTIQAWWTEETSLKNNKKNLTVQKLLNGSVYHIYIYIYILYGGGGPPGPKNARADFFVPVQPWVYILNVNRWDQKSVCQNIVLGLKTGLEIQFWNTVNQYLPADFDENINLILLL